MRRLRRLWCWLVHGRYWWMENPGRFVCWRCGESWDHPELRRLEEYHDHIARAMREKP